MTDKRKLIDNARSGLLAAYGFLLGFFTTAKRKFDGNARLVLLAMYVFLLGFLFGNELAFHKQASSVISLCHQHAELLISGYAKPEWKILYGKMLPYLLSGISVYMTILAGNKDPRAWLYGLFGQVGWLSWIVVTETWGFLILNSFMWVIYIRNHLLWNNPKEKS